MDVSMLMQYIDGKLLIHKPESVATGIITAITVDGVTVIVELDNYQEDWSQYTRRSYSFNLTTATAQQTQERCVVKTETDDILTFKKYDPNISLPL